MFGKVIVTIIMLCIITGMFAMTSVFNIDEIQVTGIKYYQESEIIDLSGINKGINGFRTLLNNPGGFLTFRYINSEEKIMEQCSYIKTVTVKYCIPEKVLIDVIERTPMGIIPYMDTGLLMDNEGFIIDVITVNDANMVNMPVIKGVEFEYFEVGQALMTKNSEGMNNAVLILEMISELDNESDIKIRNLINYIDVSDDDNIYLLIDSRIIVNIGDASDLRYRVSSMKHIFLNNIKKGDEGFLDYTVGENPIFTPKR